MKFDADGAFLPALRPYVLFREDPNTHKEVYMAEMVGKRPVSVKDPLLAMTFKSARFAYAFGADAGLDWWRVGRR
jgi:hypothetical protein